MPSVVSPRKRLRLRQIFFSWKLWILRVCPALPLSWHRPVRRFRTHGAWPLPARRTAIRRLAWRWTNHRNRQCLFSGQTQMPEFPWTFWRCQCVGKLPHMGFRRLNLFRFNVSWFREGFSALPFFVNSPFYSSCMEVVKRVRFHFEWVNTQNMKIIECPISNTECPISKEIITIFSF